MIAAVIAASATTVGSLGTCLGTAPRVDRREDQEVVVAAVVVAPATTVGSRDTCPGSARRAGEAEVAVVVAEAVVVVATGERCQMLLLNIVIFIME